VSVAVSVDTWQANHLALLWLLRVMLIINKLGNIAMQRYSRDAAEPTSSKRSEQKPLPPQLIIRNLRFITRHLMTETRVCPVVLPTIQLQALSYGVLISDTI